MSEQITLEEALKLVEFQHVDGEWVIQNVNGTVFGSVRGDVVGTVRGSVLGDVWGSVGGDVYNSVSCDFQSKRGKR